MVLILCNYENSFRETDNYKDSRALLQIVLTATSPMSLHQINVAMGINAKTSSIEGLLECLEPNMEETVTGLGRIFIAIRNDKVELIHQTARQFLLRTEASQNGQGSWRHSIDLLESNLLLAEKCVACLLMQDWVRLTKSSAIPYRPTTQTSKDAMNWQVTTSNLEIDDNPLVAWRETFDWSTKEPIKSFCTYAAKNWFHHLQVFGPSFSDQGDLVNLREQARRLCDLRQRYFGVWWSIYANINKDTRIESYMHFLAQRGDFAIMQGLVDSNSCSVFLDEDKRAFDDRGSEDENLQKRGNDLLITATKYEQKSAVEWLLQQDSDGFLEMGTALLVAIDNHMDPIVQILVDEVADLNEAHRDLASVEGRYEEDEFSKSTPLEVALRSNNLSAMNLLLENGAEFQQVDSCGYTPWAQVIFGDELKYFKGNTAVTAIKKGKESRRSEPASSTAMVEAMISHGVHPNAADYLNRTPLHYAAIAGDSDIIRTLLAAGASSDIQAKVDEESNVLRTPYRMAKALGHKEQAALLKIASPTTTTPEEYEGNYTLSSSPPPSTGLKRQASGPAGWHESRRPRSGGFDPRELGVRHGALPFREKHVVSTLRRS
ncbi:ankyrin repeat-containing domain protein [Pseudomassariella vexata]|uniref:Ankyrin repeat-containing domain protein n=1 Tax=Pseudomassariella vexata TaxID=1141098 RepID=A0A1Y2E0X9_9PEZI|nr:ankyrin repeat-containing domain protein [Pseudomassariella vexata]ORY65137.1 ankyrin repeat-containing domain protein [Pseudomassariella vexata]